MPGLEITNDDVSDLPPSAKLVYLLLQEEGELTHAEICRRTHLASRTVRHALDRLDDVDVLEDRPYVKDARKSLYSVK